MRRRKRRAWIWRAAAAGVIGALLTVGFGAVGYWNYRGYLLRGRLASGTGSGLIVDGDERGREWGWRGGGLFGARWIDLVVVDLERLGVTAQKLGVTLVPPDDWAHIRQLAGEHGLGNFGSIDRLEVGWPLRAFAVTHAWHVSGIAISGGRTLEGFNANAPGMPDWISSRFLNEEFGRSILPMRVRWPAFLGDTTLFGSLAFAGLSAPAVTRAVRRGRRRRRGLCLACGYDLKGGAGKCPECGAGRE